MYQRLHVVLKIPSHQLLYYYEGEVDVVVAKTTDGRIIRFPANIFVLWCKVMACMASLNWFSMKIINLCPSAASAITPNLRRIGFHCRKT